MVLELQSLISKREKSGIHSHGFFFFFPPLEASFPALGRSVDRLSTKAFLPCSDLVCPLPMQVPYSSLPVLPPRRGGDAPRVDLMASQTDVQLFTIKTLLASDATQGEIRVTFQNASQAKLLRETFVTWVPVHDPEYFPDNEKADMNIKLRCSFQASPHQYKSLLWSTKSQLYQRKKKNCSSNLSNL